MEYFYGISFAALILVAATFPVLLLLVEASPRVHARIGLAVAVWLIAVLGLVALGAMVYMSFADCPDYAACW